MAYRLRKRIRVSYAQPDDNEETDVVQPTEQSIDEEDFKEPSKSKVLGQSRTYARVPY
jgi:hypothetical protein